ncbi:hypothetical protein J0B03_03125 [Alkalibacter rhizosphaerae]|uniref:Uncharacterized protein n=1 Tax=Alkalibacter rhizosphaerae TaxID=2815577 RepID=A0A974XHY5_9FIRM|nr:hypothetical protein [Alkalibacter rhizosphaerae]QSX09075.1 hypothetical protein J0B03_03125 [Alkalibacter rhizosphaerae]
MDELRVYVETGKELGLDEIKEFMERNGLEDQAGVLKGTSYEEGLKNRCYFDLAEKIRFAKMQRESLRDTGAYNRHIAKSLREMNRALVILFELGVGRDEVEPVLKQYLEFTGSVQTKEAWEDYDALKVYPMFLEFDRANDAGRYRED